MGVVRWEVGRYKGNEGYRVSCGVRLKKYNTHAHVHVCFHNPILHFSCYTLTTTSSVPPPTTCLFTHKKKKKKKVPVLECVWPHPSNPTFPHGWLQPGVSRGPRWVERSESWLRGQRLHNGTGLLGGRDHRAARGERLLLRERERGSTLCAHQVGLLPAVLLRPDTQPGPGHDGVWPVALLERCLHWEPSEGVQDFFEEHAAPEANHRGCTRFWRRVRACGCQHDSTHWWVFVVVVVVVSLHVCVCVNWFICSSSPVQTGCNSNNGNCAQLCLPTGQVARPTCACSLHLTSGNGQCLGTCGSGCGCLWTCGCGCLWACGCGYALWTCGCGYAWEKVSWM